MILSRNIPGETKNNPVVECPHCHVGYSVMNVISAESKVQCQYCGTYFTVRVKVDAVAERLPELSKVTIGPIRPERVNTGAEIGWNDLGNQFLTERLIIGENNIAAAAPAPRRRTRPTNGGN